MDKLERVCTRWIHVEPCVVLKFALEHPARWCEVHSRWLPLQVVVLQAQALLAVLRCSECQDPVSQVGLTVTPALSVQQQMAEQGMKANC